jgi:outer membrane protein insertion porin family
MGYGMRKGIGIVLVFFLLFIGRGEGSEEIIQKITILGNAKVEEGVIRGALKSREGGPFSADRVREDLRSIFALDYFSDVQVDIKTTPKGREIIFIVMEKPSVKEILITGNQKLKLDEIKEKVTLAPRSIFNLEKVKENAEQIRKLYFSKGYYGVKVEHKVNYLETNEVTVTFQIEEGVKGHIKKVIFKGNKKIKSSDLKKVMQTKQWNIFSIITKKGLLDEDILKNDVQILTAYYIDHGYLNAKISEPKIDFSNPKRIRMEIEISEGPQYRFGEIDFKGDVLTTREDLFRTIQIKRNHIYSTSAIRKDIHALTEKFSNQGYANVEVNPITATDEKNLLVHLTYEIEKKNQVSFEKIQIVGNTKTRDKVVRRELQVAEGELYSATGLSKSRDRLKRTGFFKEVELTTSRGSTEDKTNLEVKVEEAPTGAFSFGVGYSSIENVVGSASVSDRNLFGLGYHALLRFRLGSETQDLRFSFTDPYFLGYNFSAGIDLYNENREFDTYSYKILGGTLHVGKELTEKFRGDATYKLERIKVSDLRADASRFIREQEGNRLTSALTFGVTMDTRNDYYNPMKGSRHTLSLTNAGGILGGDNFFVKVLAETSWYFPLPLKTVLNLRAKAGFVEPYGGRRVPIYEKFFVGGLYTVRGFEYGMAGPFDQNREPLGSDRMAAFNAELTIPLATEIGLRAALFFDVGKGWGGESGSGVNRNKGIKMGAGPGIRWFSPFGPIHIDLGFNLNPKEGEKSRVFEFTAGTVY